MLFVLQLLIIKMKWITLKLKNLPIISLQIDRALEVFQTMISKYDTFRKRDDYIQISQLRSQFKNRVAELDAFYKDHHLDQNIAIFHMLKIKLEKALFRINQFNNERSANEMSFKEDSLSLFQDHEIKLLDQPLFTYYESSVKRSNTKEDYFQFAKDAPKEEISSFGGKKAEKSDKKGGMMNSQGKGEKASQQAGKNQFSYTSNQIPKVKSGKEIITPITTNKKVPPNPKVTPSQKQPRKVDKKPNVTFKPATFSSSHLQKIQQQKSKQKKTLSPQSNLLQSNFLQCLNSNQSQLKFTIKMTKDEYRSLLEMKKKLSDQSKF